MRIYQFISTAIGKYPLFYILTPVFLFLHIENDHRNLIRYAFVYKEMIMLVIAAVAIYLLSHFTFRESKTKASLFAFLILCIFYFFCDIKDSIHVKDKTSIFGRYSFLTPVVAVIIIAGFTLLKKANLKFTKTFQFLNLLLLAFVVNEIIQLFTPRTTSYITQTTDQRVKLPPCDTCRKPDIYYLLFDGYTSFDVLENEFGYSNNSIKQFLLEKGFYIADSSQSNYNLTPFSIASCFNLSYLPNIDTTKEYYIKDYLPGLEAVYKSQLATTLADAGYDIINHSIFDLENYPTKNPHFNLWDIDELYRRHNFFIKVDSDIGWQLRKLLPVEFSLDDSREYIIAKDKHFLQTVQSVQETIGQLPRNPTFVYGHFVLPHPASYLDSGGTALQGVVYPTDVVGAKEKYVEHVALSNKLIKDLITRIQVTGRPSVIVIQGDHGYKEPLLYNKQLEFANLNAILFPDKTYKQLYPTISNVNTFRIIFNKVYETRLPLLTDSTFFLKYK